MMILSVKIYAFSLGGFYKLISWDFGVVFEQIAVQNMKNVQWTFDGEAENKRATRLSDKQQDAEKRSKSQKSILFFITGYTLNL